MSTYGEGDVWLALADRTRRTIVMRLADGERAVGELAAELPISQPAVSQHLKLLKDLGLVSDRAVGNRRIYRLNEAGVLALRDQLDSFWSRTLAGFSDVVARDSGANIRDEVWRDDKVERDTEIKKEK